LIEGLLIISNFFSKIFVFIFMLEIVFVDILVLDKVVGIVVSPASFLPRSTFLDYPHSDNKIITLHR
jgi:hypothetical protein